MQTTNLTAMAVSCCLVLLSSCGAPRDETAAQVQATTSPAVAPEVSGVEAEKREPWERDDFCPEGTKRLGSAPPADIEVRCQKEDGTLHGPYLLWWQNGNKRVVGGFEDDSEQGTFQKWSADGKAEDTEIYRDGALVFAEEASTTKAVPSGLSAASIKRGWWRRKNPCPKGSTLEGQGKPKGNDVYCAIDEVPNGPATEWHIDLDIRDHLDRGTDSSMNDRVGAIAEVGHFVDGDKEGEWYSFDKDGRMWRKSSWKGGLAFGTWSWLQGKKQIGTAERDDTQRPTFDSVPDAWWTAGDKHCPKGSTLKEESMVRVSSGRSLECQWPDGTRHGPSVLLGTTGLVERSSHFRDGQEHGVSLHFTDGKLRRRVRHVEGMKHGLEVERDGFKKGKLTETMWRRGRKIYVRRSVPGLGLSFEQFDDHGVVVK